MLLEKETGKKRVWTEKPGRKKRRKNGEEEDDPTPWKCVNCGKAFGIRADLIEHRRLEHKKEPVKLPLGTDGSIFGDGWEAKLGLEMHIGLPAPWLPPGWQDAKKRKEKWGNKAKKCYVNS